MPKIENALCLLSFLICVGLINLAVLSSLYHYTDTLTDTCEPTVLDVFGVTLDGLGSSEKEGCRTFIGSVQETNQNAEKFPGCLRRSVGFLTLGILLLSVPAMLVICVVDQCLFKILFPRRNSLSHIRQDMMSIVDIQNNRPQGPGGGDGEPPYVNGPDDPEPPSPGGALAVALNPLRFFFMRLSRLEQKRSRVREVIEPGYSAGKPWVIINVPDERIGLATGPSIT